MMDNVEETETFKMLRELSLREVLKNCLSFERYIIGWISPWLQVRHMVFDTEDDSDDEGDSDLLEHEVCKRCSFGEYVDWTKENTLTRNVRRLKVEVESTGWEVGGYVSED